MALLGASAISELNGFQLLVTTTEKAIRNQNRLNGSGSKPFPVGLEDLPKTEVRV